MTALGPGVVALERLAAALGPGEFATVMVTAPGQPPRLSVVSRHTGAAEEIYADDLAYWWEWAEKISTHDDPLTAAHHVAATLRAVPPL